MNQQEIYSLHKLRLLLLLASLFVYWTGCKDEKDQKPVSPFYQAVQQHPVHAPKPEIITRLPAGDSVIALTFDACETRTPSYFDTTLLMYILRNRVPATFFINGPFAERNRKIIEMLAWIPFIEIENHSYAHIAHMERMDSISFMQDVLKNEKLLYSVTGRKPKLFRFPGGNYDAAALRRVAGLGYHTVHWSYASGDADSAISPQRLKRWIFEKTKPGNILIFHINRRGYHTAEILPAIVDSLSAKGYKFILLKEYLY